MKLVIKKFFYLIFFIFITNTYSLKSHDSFNGGCDHHCKKSKKSIIKNESMNSTNVKKQIEDNYSCLRKSLCRG